jgi:adenosylhomocysteine nucleosidase
MIVAVTGLDREARIIARPEITTVIGGGDRCALEMRVRSAIDAGARRVLSIGICGGLTSSLSVGDCVIATEIVAGSERLATNVAWTRDLAAQVPGAKLGVIAGSDAIVFDRSARRRLHDKTSAVAVDMESHVAAKIAHEHCLPFAALRVVSDTHRQPLPPAALVAMLPNGKINVRAVLRSLALRPTQIPVLIRTAWEAEKAFQALFRCRHVLAAAPADAIAAAGGLAPAMEVIA